MTPAILQIKAEIKRLLINAVGTGNISIRITGKHTVNNVVKALHALGYSQKINRETYVIVACGFPVHQSKKHNRFGSSYCDPSDYVITFKMDPDNSWYAYNCGREISREGELNLPVKKTVLSLWQQKLLFKK